MKDKLTLYLLGELPEADSEKLEEQYFSDPELYEELRAAECDLIDAYVKGELSRHEKERCQQHFFAAASRQEKLKAALAIARHTAPAMAKVDAAPRWWQRLINWQASVSFWQFSAAMATLLIAATAIIWLVIDSNRMRGEIATLRAQQPASPVKTDDSESRRLAEQLAQERARTRELSEQLAQTHAQHSPLEPKQTPEAARAPISIAFTLLPIAVRSGTDSESLKVPANTETVKFNLKYAVDENYQQLSASLMDADGKKIWQQAKIKIIDGKKGLAEFAVPANKLISGDYLIELSGINAQGESDTVANYTFSLTK